MLENRKIDQPPTAIPGGTEVEADDPFNQRESVRTRRDRLLNSFAHTEGEDPTDPPVSFGMPNIGGGSLTIKPLGNLFSRASSTSLSDGKVRIIDLSPENVYQDAREITQRIPGNIQDDLPENLQAPVAGAKQSSQIVNASGKVSTRVQKRSRGSYKPVQLPKDAEAAFSGYLTTKARITQLEKEIQASKTGVMPSGGIPFADHKLSLLESINANNTSVNKSLVIGGLKAQLKQQTEALRTHYGNRFDFSPDGNVNVKRGYTGKYIPETSEQEQQSQFVGAAYQPPTRPNLKGTGAAQIAEGLFQTLNPVAGLAAGIDQNFGTHIYDQVRKKYSDLYSGLSEEAGAIIAGSGRAVSELSDHKIALGKVAQSFGGQIRDVSKDVKRDFGSDPDSAVGNALSGVGSLIPLAITRSPLGAAGVSGLAAYGRGKDAFESAATGAATGIGIGLAGKIAALGTAAPFFKNAIADEAAKFAVRSTAYGQVPLATQTIGVENRLPTAQEMGSAQLIGSALAAGHIDGSRFQRGQQGLVPRAGVYRGNPKGLNPGFIEGEIIPNEPIRTGQRLLGTGLEPEPAQNLLPRQRLLGKGVDAPATRDDVILAQVKSGGQIVDLTNGARPTSIQPGISPIETINEPSSKTYTLEDSGAVRRQPFTGTQEKPIDTTQFRVAEEASLIPIQKDSVASKMVDKAKGDTSAPRFKGDYLRIREVNGKPVVLVRPDVAAFAGEVFDAGTSIDGAYFNKNQFNKLLSAASEVAQSEPEHAQFVKELEAAQPFFEQSKGLIAVDSGASYHEMSHNSADNIRNKYGIFIDPEIADSLAESNPAQKAAREKVFNQLVENGYGEDFDKRPDLFFEETFTHLAGGSSEWNKMGLDSKKPKDRLAAFDLAEHAADTITETHKERSPEELDDIVHTVLQSARPGQARELLKGAFENVRTKRSQTDWASRDISSQEGRTGQRTTTDLIPSSRGIQPTGDRGDGFRIQEPRSPGTVQSSPTGLIEQATEGAAGNVRSRQTTQPIEPTVSGSSLRREDGNVRSDDGAGELTRGTQRTPANQVKTKTGKRTKSNSDQLTLFSRSDTRPSSAPNEQIVQTRSLPTKAETEKIKPNTYHAPTLKQTVATTKSGRLQTLTSDLRSSYNEPAYVVPLITHITAADTFNERDLVAFRNSYLGLVKGHPELTITTSQHNGLIHIDLDAALEDRDQAIELGKKLNRPLITDLFKYAVIETGANETLSSLSAPEIAQALHEIKGIGDDEAEYARKPKAIETARGLIKSEGYGFRKATGRSFNPESRKDREIALQIASKQITDFYTSEPERAARAASWYNRSILELENILKEADPRFNDPNRTSLFKLALAITSPATSVKSNFQYAYKLLEGFNEKTGEFPVRQTETREDGEFKKFGAHTSRIEKLNEFFKQFSSYSDALDYLLEPNPTTNEFRVLSELGDWKKMGRFWLNLEGIGSEATIDLWMMRWWRLLTGGLIGRDTANEQIINEEVRNGSEARYVRDFLSDLTSKLNQEHSLELDAASTQAVLWYLIQEKFGARASQVDFTDAAEYFLPTYLSTKQGTNEKEIRERIREAKSNRKPDSQERFQNPTLRSVEGLSKNPERGLTYQEEAQPVRFSRSLVDPFYSTLAKVLDQKLPASAPVDMVRGILDNPQNAIKKDERKWSDIDSYLDKVKAKGEKVNKSELASWLQAHSLQIEEKFLKDDEETGLEETHYSDPSFNLSGGEKYREILFYIPSESLQKGRKASYSAPHFHPDHHKNLIAHARIDEIIDTEGKRVLRVQEVQSDLDNDLRSPSVLDKKKARLQKLMPFSNYQEFVWKRLLRMAVEDGFDKLAWTTGEQQIDRWGDSYGWKNVDEIRYEKSGESLKLEGLKNGEQVYSQTLSLAAPDQNDSLNQLVGANVAKQIKDSGQATGAISGQGLSVGGQGKRLAYDVIPKSFLNKYLKRFGASVGATEFATRETQKDERLEVSGIEIERRKLFRLIQRVDLRRDSDSDAANSRGETAQVLAGLYDIYDQMYDGIEPFNEAAKFAFDRAGEENEVRIMAALEYLSKQFEDARYQVIQGGEEQRLPLHSVEITPEMKEAFLYQGQPLFSKKPTPATAPTKTPLPEFISALRKTGLLSSFRTSVTNNLGNAAFQLTEELARIPASIVDALISTQTGSRTVAPPTLEQFSDVNTWKKAAQDFKSVFVAGMTPAQAAAYNMPPALTQGRPLADAYIRYVANWYSAQDSFFKAFAYRRGLDEIAHLTALNEQKAGKIKPSQFETRKQDIMAGKGLSAIDLARMDLFATQAAEYVTFTNKNQLASMVDTLIKGGDFKGKVFGVPMEFKSAGSPKWLEFGYEWVAPFRNTPSNVVARLAEYAFGLPKAAIRGIVHGKDIKNWSRLEQREFANNVGKGSITAALLALGFALATKELLIGMSSENEKDKRRTREAAGLSDGSIRFFGHSVSINQISPAGALMVLGATIHDLWNREEMDEAEGELPKSKFATAADAVSKSVIGSHPLAEGSDRLLDAIQKPSQNAGNYAKTQATSIIPSIVNDAAQLFDDKDREAGTLGEALAKKVPGLRNTLPEKKDVLGRTVEKSLGERISNLLIRNASTSRETPALKELNRLNVFPASVKPEQGEAKTDTAARTANRDKKRAPAIEALVNSPEYQTLPDTNKQKVLRNVLNSSSIERIPNSEPDKLKVNAQRQVFNSTVNDKKNKAIENLRQNEEYVALSDVQKVEVQKRVNSLFERYSIGLVQSTIPDNRKVEMKSQVFERAINSGFLDKKIARVIEIVRKRIN